VHRIVHRALAVPKLFRIVGALVGLCAAISCGSNEEMGSNVPLGGADAGGDVDASSGGTGGASTAGSTATAGGSGRAGQGGGAGTGGVGASGAGGNAGAGGLAGTADAGATEGGISCEKTPCAEGSVCVSQTVGPQILPATCAADPCAPQPLDCSCASTLCRAGVCMIRDGGVTCLARCAAPDTPIATPSGEQPIATLRVGDLVYSVDAGQLRAVPILETSRTRAEHHHVMRVSLENGRVLEISPGHPTADGQTFADLRAGTFIGEARVVEAHLVPYAYSYTHDILPASDTGTYIAAGALIGSTLGGLR
jgi:hypothetical protein